MRELEHLLFSAQFAILGSIHLSLSHPLGPITYSGHAVGTYMTPQR